MKFTKYSLVAIGTMAILTGCGGGGGGDKEPPKEKSKNEVQFDRFGGGIKGTLELKSPSDIPNTPSPIYQVKAVEANGCQFDQVVFDKTMGQALPNSPFLIDYGFNISENLTDQRCISDKVTIWYEELANTDSIPFKRRIVIPNPDYDQSKVHKSSGDDPLYKYQWHLKNTGKNEQQKYVITKAKRGNDINVESVWDSGLTGKDIKIAVLDEGVDMFHPDLNVDKELSHNYHSKPQNSKNTTPFRIKLVMDDPHTEGEEQIIGGWHDWPHGTAVAGLIAAKGWNGIGTRGVAPKATIVSYNTLEPIVYTNTSESRELYEKSKIQYLYHVNQMQHIRTLDGLVRNLDKIAIYNNSWGNPFPTLQKYSEAYDISDNYEQQLTYGSIHGRDGKGAIYVKSAGNSSEGWTNFEPMQTDGYFIIVSASDADGKASSYTTQGPNILVNAPGGGSDNEFTKIKEHHIVTTDMAGLARGYDFENTYLSKVPHFNAKGNENGDYTNRMNGTSSSAPIVSGVVALMLEANPNLTWRDVRYILAHSAYKNDLSDDSWKKNGAGLYYSYVYGFGRVNAQEAVNMSKNFSTLGGFYELKKAKGTNQTTTKKADGHYVSKIKVDKNIKIEHLKITLTLDQNSTTEYETHNFQGTGNDETTSFELYAGKNIFTTSSQINANSGEQTTVTLLSSAIDADPEKGVEIAKLEEKSKRNPVKKIVDIAQKEAGDHKLIIDSNATNWSVNIQTPIPKSLARNIEVTLKSPSNTVSLLAPAPNSLDENQTYTTSKLSSLEFMDENSQGEWTLEVKDTKGHIFEFIDWTLEATGH